MTELLSERSTAAPVLPSAKLNKGQVIEMLAHLILAARPLAERVASDDFSSEDRRRLRELTTSKYESRRSDALFQLSNLLYELVILQCLPHPLAAQLVQERGGR